MSRKSMDQDQPTENLCIGTRKRAISGTEYCEPKKSRSTNEMNDTALKSISPADIPKMRESELFLFSAIQNLANNISDSFNMVNNRMSQLETNIEEKISAKIQTVLKTQIEEEVSKVNDELKEDMQAINTKIEDVQKSYEKLSKEKTSHFKTDIRNNIIIRNLRYDEREKDNAEITKNLIQALFRDGFALSDMNIKSVFRKNGIFQGNVRTLLKEIGKDKEFMFVGNKLVQKKY
ncbi:unnamed protein product [Mytilus coruscus]|uniref:Uncharacterized protein n=1 Tax=Mytilus coruscus TaxID=42192 RepID=A0A6J8A9A1_MYTCO|nr:unnamed protein product [Mytilus coruscus]